MDDNILDYTVTSPPYNKKESSSSQKQLDKKYIPGVNTNGVMKKIEHDSFSDSLPEQEYQGQQIELLNVLCDKTRESGSLFYKHMARYLKGHSQVPWERLLKTKWHVREEIVWCRGGAVGLPVQGTNHC